MNQLLRIPSLISCRSFHTKKLKRSPPRYGYFYFKNFFKNRCKIVEMIECEFQQNWSFMRLNNLNGQRQKTLQ
jgi:hypothetical protein